MKIVNITGNSVYIEDIDIHFSYEHGKIYEIDTDTLKRSESLQKIIILGGFDIIGDGESRIEKNVIKKQADHKILLNAQKKEIEEERMESGIIPEVIIKGHFYEAGGYAKVNRNLAITLYKMGCKVEISPCSTRRNDLNEIELMQISRISQKVGRKAIKIDSIIPSFSEASPGRGYRILYTTTESSTVPKQTVDVCNSYNEVWVTSDFCKDALFNHGVKRPIFVIPSSVDDSLYREDGEVHEFIPKLKPFIFVSVFGWSHRKGYDALLKSYLKEFSGDDPVSLLIISRYQYSSNDKGFIEGEINKFIKKYGGNNPAHIARCGRVIPENDMPKVYRACNAFVLPSRGEGFGVPYTESSLCGLPNIATNYSGHTMFLKDNDMERNSYLVDIDRVEKLVPGQMHVHYWDNQMFPLLTSDSFISNFGAKMREVYENYDQAKNRNKVLQNRIKNTLSCDSSIKIAKERINEIWKKISEV